MTPENPKAKHGRRSIIIPGNTADDMTAEALEKRLGVLAFQNRAPSVAKAAATELLERKSPRVRNPEQGLTPNEARQIVDIYERLFGDRDPASTDLTATTQQEMKRYSGL